MKERQWPSSMERVPCSSYQFPPGFRFHPSDEELIVHYLQNKVSSRPIPASIIAEIELYKHNPWELPMRASFGDDEWYFFSPRDRKYPNGVRPNRAAGSGYWKATGTDKPILSSSGSTSIGVKKALVFYTGRPPKGVKTDWIMNEYRLVDATIKPSRLKGSMRLDDWVLCRVQRKGNFVKNPYEIQESSGKVMDLVGNLPTIGEANTTQTSHNSMIIDYLNKDCRLLASVLAGEHFLPIDINSCVSFQESNKGSSSNSAYEEASDKMNSPITVSSFDNYNLLKRKPNEGDSYDNFLQSYKWLNCGNSGEGLLPGEKFSESDVNYYSQTQSQGGFYNPDPSAAVTEFLDHGGLPFTPKYLQ